MKRPPNLFVFSSIGLPLEEMDCTTVFQTELSPEEVQEHIDVANAKFIADMRCSSDGTTKYVYSEYVRYELVPYGSFIEAPIIHTGG